MMLQCWSKSNTRSLWISGGGHCHKFSCSRCPKPLRTHILSFRPPKVTASSLASPPVGCAQLPTSPPTPGGFGSSLQATAAPAPTTAVPIQGPCKYLSLDPLHRQLLARPTFSLTPRGPNSALPNEVESPLFL